MPQSISAEPLARMVKSITLQKRTGVLRVEQLGGRSAERGAIYFENGSMVRAQTERETGKAALQCIREWKQITCSFQSISRPPYQAQAPLRPSRELQIEERQASLPAQTDPLARMPDLRDTEPRGSAMHHPLHGGGRTTHPLYPRSAEIDESANREPAIKSASQSLVLRGAHLEPYAPVQPSSPPRSVQRWTTHLISELETIPVPRKPPATPRLFPQFTEEVLPGRKAIFKARAVASMPQAIQQMERHARLVFILLDGSRTIEAIARLTRQTEQQTEQIVIDLTQRGYAYYLCG
ncbi:MAG TPA: DUF4388 domain-containing protein [Ktedonobacteraceae bacterium]